MLNVTILELGLMWISSVCVGAVIGIVLQEKIDQRLFEKLKDELEESHNEIEQIKKEILRK